MYKEMLLFFCGTALYFFNLILQLHTTASLKELKLTQCKAHPTRRVRIHYNYSMILSRCYYKSSTIRQIQFKDFFITFKIIASKIVKKLNKLAHKIPNKKLDSW